MPEIISKYPDIVLQILREASMQCGTGAKQQILVNCPAERFCSLPTGELCIYGLNDASKMTQVKSADLAQAVSNASQPVLTIETIFLMLVALIVGIVVGILVYRKIRK